MKIVFLDAKTIGEDIDLSDYDKLGQVVKYDFSTPDEICLLYTSPEPTRH